MKLNNRTEAVKVLGFKVTNKPGVSMSPTSHSTHTLTSLFCSSSHTSISLCPCVLILTPAEMDYHSSARLA